MDTFDRNIKWTSKIVRGPPAPTGLRRASKEVPVIFYKFKKDGVLDEYEKISRKFFRNSPRIFLVCGPRHVFDAYEVLRSRLKKLVVVGWRDLTRKPERILWFLGQCRINALITYPVVLLRLGGVRGGHGRTKDFRIRSQLKYIQLIEAQGRPRMNAKEKKLLRKFYPRAKFMRVYGIGELDKIGFQCKYLGKTISDQYHFSNEVRPEVGPSNELLVSIPRRFNKPLIRYRTGDKAKIYDRKCLCGRKRTIKIATVLD